MRLKTSYFNAYLFRKTVVRFWPTWFAYAFIWAIILPVSLGSSIASALRYPGNSSGLIYALQSLPLRVGQYGGTVIGAIVSCLAAMGVFSHLYFARSAGAFAALPLKRESVFVSAALAGLLPMLAINLVIFVAALLVEAAYGLLYLPALLQWLAMVSMLDLFFFGFSTLCAQLTGSLIVLPFVYAVLNFTAYVVEYLVSRILDIFVFGYSGSALSLDFLSPIIALFSHCQVSGITAFDAVNQTYSTVGFYFTGWGWIIGYTAAGAILLSASLLLYKRRRMETAGDVVAVRSLKPVFKYCLALGCALCLGAALFSILCSGYTYVGTPKYVLAITVFMLIGCFIGYFAAEMLIHKSFSVWNGKRRWLGFCVVSAVIAALTFSCEFDLFGYEKRLPAEGEIESVSLMISGDNTLLSDTQNIESVLKLHESIIENKHYHESEAGSTCYLYLTYTLKDESTMNRNYRLAYSIDQKTGDVRTLEDLVNTQEAIDYRKRLDFSITAENIDYASVDYRTPDTAEYDYEHQELILTAEEANAFYYECILPDIKDGTLGRIWLIYDEDYLNTVYACTINFECNERSSEGEYTYQRFYTVPTVDSTRTNAWLREHGVDLHTESEFQYGDNVYAEKYAVAKAASVTAD